MIRYLITATILFHSAMAYAVSPIILDKKACSLPLRDSQTPVQLVQTLTKGLTDPADKARVLASWVACQNDKNGFEYQKRINAGAQNKPADSALTNDMFLTRIGTPEEFAKLYTDLARLAGLEVETVYGYYGDNIPSNRYKSPEMQALEPIIDQFRGTDYSLQQYESAWNAVKIGEHWQLVDTYAMQAGRYYVGRDQDERGMERLLSRREKSIARGTPVVRAKKIDKAYFFAKPREFIKDHFPFHTRWQLLDSPRSWRSFTK